MLIELLSTCNYVSYNIQIAHVLGLHTAIYLSELMNINDKAIKKDKMSENCFTVDRKYITKRTTLQESEQKEIETFLLKAGILEKGANKDNKISINLTALTTIIMAPDEKLLGDLAKLKSNSVKSRTKTNVFDNLKSSVSCVNDELRVAYYDWIEAVLTKDNYMTKTAVVSGQKIVDEASGRNLDVALRIIEIAAINGYRDMSWAVNSYNESMKSKQNGYSIPKPVLTDSQFRKPVSLGDKVF